MRPWLPLVSILSVVAVACAGPDRDTTAGGGPDVERGQELFAANCAVCHGQEARGTETGPPLLHELYVPSHHSDESFQAAVTRGVQPHHWDFGAMPPVQGLSRDDVADIVAHVRQLQREAGIIE